MTRARHDPHSYLPLKAVDFHVLLVLTGHELHGYGIVKEIESRSGGRLRLEPGNLYRYIRRLVQEGMIEAAARRASSCRIPAIVTASISVEPQHPLARFM